MSNRSGFKHTPIGWIPEEWHIKEFAEVSSKILDGTHFSPKSKNGHYKYITSKNIRNEGLDLTDVTYIDEKEHIEIFKRCPVIYDDILLTKDGAGTGTCCKNSLNEPFSLLSSVAVIRSNDDVCHNDYLFQYIKSPRGQFVIKDAIAGQAITRITLEKIRSFDIIIPTIPEQRRIAAILSTWDEAITKTQQLIIQLQQRNKGLMQQLLTAKGSWKEYRIGDLLKEVKRPVSWNEEELYYLISVRRRSGGAFFRESLYGKQILTKQLFTAEEGDFLISKMQIIHGASAVVPKELAGMKISGSYIAIHTKDGKLMDIDFFNWLSKTRWFYRMTYVSSYGVHIEKMTFDYDDFKRRKIMLPPTVEEQKSIVELLQTATDEVNLLEQKLVAIQKQKKGLMQKLLTGEVRVKIDN